MARGGEGHPWLLSQENSFFLFICIKLSGWRHVRGVGGWVTGGSRAQVSVLAEEKQIKTTHARDYFT